MEMCEICISFFTPSVVYFKYTTTESSILSVTIPATSNQQVIANIESGGYSLIVNEAKRVGMSAYKNGQYSFALSPVNSITTNQKYYLAGRANNQYEKITLNEETATHNNAAAIKYPGYNTYMVLGLNPYKDGLNNYGSPNEAFNGYIYTARMYSKVLTDDELQKHYVIDKWRFNF